MINNISSLCLRYYLLHDFRHADFKCAMCSQHDTERKMDFVIIGNGGINYVSHPTYDRKKETLDVG